MAVFTTADRLKLEAQAGIKFDYRGYIVKAEGRKVEEPMSERGLVVFTEKGHTYGVYLPTNGVAANVRKVLTASQVNLRLAGSTVTASELAAEFLAKVRNNTDCRARLGEDYGDLQYQVDYAYYLIIANGRVEAVEVFARVHGYNKTLLFKGSFNDWLTSGTSMQERLSGFVKRVVTFNYQGGSINGRRIVRVESVNNSRIFGEDVEKGEPRSFLLNKIKGEVTAV
jgi:hypothetical protein